MKKLLNLLIAISTSISLLFGQDSNDTFLPIENDVYRITYPADWRADESGEYGTAFIIYSPKDAEDDMFNENINLTIQDLTGYNLNFEAYVDISLEQIENMMMDSELISSETTMAHGRQYHKVLYTSKQENFKLMFEQYFWVIGTNAYLLTFTCEASKFASYQELSEQVMNSFVLK